MLRDYIFQIRLALLPLTGAATLLLTQPANIAVYIQGVLFLLLLAALRDLWLSSRWSSLMTVLELIVAYWLTQTYGGLGPLYFVSLLLSYFQSRQTAGRLPLVAVTFVLLLIAGRSLPIETLLLTCCFYAACARLLIGGRRLTVGNEELQRLFDELRRKHYELEEARSRILEYAQRVEVLAQAEERNRIAHDLHDDLGHKLIRLKMMLEAVLLLPPEQHDKARAVLEQVRDQLGESMDTMRRTVRRLKPNEAEVQSFSLDVLVDELRRDTGIRIQFETTGVPVFVYPSAEVVLYRNAQEAITNAVRHGDATEIHLSVHYGESETRLTVSNNGAVPDRSAKRGLGLSGMEERTVLLGGLIEVHYEPHFSVVTIIPSRHPQAQP